MATAIDITKPKTGTAKTARAVTAAPHADIHQDRRWTRLRVVLLSGACMHCKRTPATVLDHHVPASAGVDPFDPYNLIPVCRRCHDWLTSTYDAPQGIRGAPVAGKPDPRDDMFRARVAALVHSGAVARALTVARRTAAGRARDSVRTRYATIQGPLCG